LLVAYINRDSNRFAVHLKDALEEGLTAKQRAIYEGYSTFSVPAHLKKSEIQELVDARGNNVTFSNFGALGDQAQRWLVKADSDRFVKRTARERAVVNALIAVRNHLAHQSERSFVAMNDALDVGALHPTGLKRGQNNIHHVGTYLKARVASKNATRLQIFLSELRTVATAL
jgi:hypothetical protein